MPFSREKVLVFCLLAVVLLVNTTVLWPETRISRVDLNDNVFHYSLVERIVQAIQHGENPLDCWSPEWSFGFPVLRVYQPLAHWLVVAAWYLTGKYFSLLTIFVVIRFLSLALLPLSFFVAARGLGFPLLTCRRGRHSFSPRLHQFLIWRGIRKLHMGRQRALSASRRDPPLSALARRRLARRS